MTSLKLRIQSWPLEELIEHMTLSVVWWELYRRLERERIPKL